MTLEEMEADIGLFNKSFISIEEFFKEKEKIILNDKKLGLFLNGVKLDTKLENRNLHDL